MPVPIWEVLNYRAKGLDKIKSEEQINNKICSFDFLFELMF